MVRHVMRNLRRFLLLVAASLIVAGCASTNFGNRSLRPRDSAKMRLYTLESTGYCECRECCGWHRNWLFQPVTASGRPKKVGYTASGTKARPGTIAADTSIFPFGTIMYVPGYGYGRVEDRGGNVKGWTIDLFFDDHEDAKKWGRVRRQVQVWLPQEL